MPKPRSKKAAAKAPSRPAAKKRKPARPVSRPAPAKLPAPKKAQPAQLALVPAASPEPAGKAFPIEIDPKRIEATLTKLGDELGHWAKKGRYTKVRFKFRGKQLLPDLPLAAVVAAEGLTFYWGGILRALLMNVGANTIFGVELVNDSAKKLVEGKERLLRGDLDEALELFRTAADMDRDNPTVHLNIGIALKLKGDRPGARAALEKARALDPKGLVGDEADKVLSTLPSQVVVTQINEPPPSGAV